ncbi:MAG: hypothetical protein ACKO1N_08130 [Erythrobacter sp.]
MPRFLMLAPVAVAALALSACATRPYTGPVEVTRFVAPNPDGLGQGPIVVYFPDEVSNANAKAAIRAAVESELRALGYTVVAQEGRGIQVAAVRTTRQAVPAQVGNQRGGVNVGVGGGVGGGFGGGGFGGVGVGIDLGSLGGGREGPSANTELSVRITNDATATLWEGRAQLATGVKSPYSEVNTSARTLAAGLFRNFPGGNGETVTINVKKLQGSK